MGDGPQSTDGDGDGDGYGNDGAAATGEGTCAAACLEVSPGSEGTQMLPMTDHVCEKVAFE